MIINCVESEVFCCFFALDYFLPGSLFQIDFELFQRLTDTRVHNSIRYQQLVPMAGILKHFKKVQKPSISSPLSPSEPPLPPPLFSQPKSPRNASASSSESELSTSTVSMTSNDTSVSNVEADHMEVERTGITAGTSSVSETEESPPHVLGSFFDNKKQPSQPILKSYPSRKMGSKDRRFNNGWFDKYKWLEYNVNMDACFCFPCRVFLANSPEEIFTETGFRNWKNAKASGKKKRGLDLHADCKSHRDAMLLWVDSENRRRQSATIGQAILKITSEQQQWLLAVFNVAKFLAANGLPFRGDEDGDLDGDGKGTGLFQCMFSQFLFQLEPKWKEVYKNLPENAQYTSPTIQNEVIAVLASLVKRTISDDVRAAEVYTIMADGTTDKNRKEVQGLVCRYLGSNGDIEEHCVNIKGVDDRSAKGIFEFIKDTLKDLDIPIDGVVSQSYDGASVMSGEYNGLQALISQFSNRDILYVHCFLHKISLVVVNVMKQVAEIESYFSTSSAIYNFFKKSAVLECYEGSALKRLIETRWSGHYESVSHINKNFGDITHALAGVAFSKKLNSEDKAIATGLLEQMCRNDNLFMFLNCMLKEILTPVNIIVKQLQSSSENIVSALSVVNSVRDNLKVTREGLNDEKCENIVTNFKNADDIVEVETRVKRKTKTPVRLEAYFLTENIPSENEPPSNLQFYVEALDSLEREFDRRFASDNTELWTAMEALSPSSQNFLDVEILKPLYEYSTKIPVIKEIFVKSHLSFSDLDAECRIFARVLLNKEWPRHEHGKIDLVAVARYMEEDHKETAPVLTMIYRVAVTAGFTSTRVECLFSSLSRVDTALRKSMSTTRECDLAYLAFESNVLLKKINFEMFLHEWKLKPRKLFNI